MRKRKSAEIFCRQCTEYKAGFFMNINQTRNAAATGQSGWPEEAVLNGKKVKEEEKGLTGAKAVSYDNSQNTSKVKNQNGLATGTYKATGNEEEIKKSIIEENMETEENSEEALTRSANTLTEEDCATLEEEGMTLEAYEAERLSRAILRMKENRQFTEENLESRIVKGEEYDKEIQKIALKNKISDATARKLGQKLIEAGLPLTEANLAAMAQALSMGDGIAALSDDSIAYMLENQQEATIENIYQASYTGKTTLPAGEGVWEAVRSQVEAVIEGSGRPVNEETLEEGRWLLDHELPVTEENLEELENLQGIRTQADEDYLLDRMTEAVQKGRLPKEANLDLETVRTRRQLEEIRLSMSEQASKALEEKGIVIDTEHMKEVIEELRIIEKEYYKALFSEAGEVPEEKNVNLLEETLKKAEAVGKSPAYILGRTLETSKEETLETLYQTGEALKHRAARAEEAYEPLWTAPRTDMGDSIQKAFQNTGTLLSELGLEATEENQRAVRILGYNRMEITEEVIDRVKAYDARVNEVLNGLKPKVTVELIRRGENPLNMPLDELKASIDEIKNTIGAGSEEKYSTYLWKLEKQGGQITEEERKSYIGIYRLLNNIEKTDGAALGAVLNAGRELTLSNLLAAVRTFKNKGINQKIDDSFGELESLSFSSESISEQIETAFRYTDKTEYLNSLVSRTLEEVSPEQIIKTVEKANGTIMDMSLEAFCEQVRAQEKDVRLETERQREQMELIQTLAQDSQTAVAFLDAYRGEKTIRNIQAAGEWFTGNKNLFKEIDKKADTISEDKKNIYREAAEELLDSMETEEAFEAEYQRTADVMSRIIRDAFSERELVSEEAQVLQVMQKGIALASRLSRQEHYEMPVVIGDEVSSLSLTILKGTKESGKTEVRIDFPQQGVVEAELTIKKDEIKGFILCETTDGQQLIEGCLEDMKKGFEGLGLTVKQINVSTNSKAASWSAKEAKTEGKPAETRMLYQAAKLLVKQTIERTQVISNEN